MDRPAVKRIRTRIATCRTSVAPLTERADVRKSRVGGWRILFTANRETNALAVLTFDTRGQVYKHS
jgi:mRNA-degrading endonuclease RelE of RelBE toxin-antitoxin system